MERKIITVYVTLFCMKYGIRVARGYVDRNNHNLFHVSETIPGVVPTDQFPVSTVLFMHDSIWHETKEGATRRAEQQRVNKIRGLKSQLHRAESIAFIFPEITQTT